jgi:hypothetical protein
MLVGRKWYDLLRATDPQTLTDVQRAARFLYVLKASFASRVAHPTYHWHVVQPPGLNLDRLPELLENTHRRLERRNAELWLRTFLSHSCLAIRRSTGGTSHSPPSPRT